MLYAFIWCGLWGRQQWARQRMYRESDGEGVWSVNQNSNCNWSLTSIIAFNYIYLFARRLLSCPTCPASLPPWLPTVPYPSWCCPLSLLLMTPWWWCVACACACAGQLATGFGWRPCRLVSLWFAFHLCMRPGHVYYFISFHFIWVFSFARPLYYDYHVLFNNWCANWQLSGSFTTLHTWRTTTAAAEAEGREPVGWHSLCFRSINHIVIYSGKHI